MTSRTLSLNLFKGECKRKLWLYALTLIGLIGLQPGSLLMNIDRWIIWGLMPTQIINSIKSEVSINVGDIGIIFLLVSVFYAAICFGYMFSRSKVDLYHSMPIRRHNAFTVRYLSGLLPFVLIQLLASLLEILVVAVKGYGGHGIAAIIMNTFAYSIFIFMVGYSLSILALSLTGNLLIGMLLIIAALIGEEFIEMVIGWYRSYCFQTYSYISRENFSWWRFVLSPSNMPEKLGTFISDNVTAFILLIATAVVCTIIALVLYIKRPSETAGKALAYPVLQPIVRIPAVIMAALSGGIYLVFVSGEFMTAKWFWMLFIIAAVITHVILEIVLQLDFKKAFRHWVQLIVSVAAAAVIACFFLYDLGGFDRYVPEESKVESMAIALTDLDGDISNYVTGSDGIPEYEDKTMHILKNMKSKESGAIRQLANLGIASIDPERSVFKRLDKQRELNNMSYEEWAEKYGIDSEENSLYYTVRYDLKGGRSVYRAYSAKLSEAYASAEVIYNSEEYKNASYQISEIKDADMVKTVEFTDALYNTVFKLEHDDIRGLLEAYEKDLNAMTLKRIADEYPIYAMQSVNIRTDMYMDLLYGYYIYPDYENTLRYLESKGMVIDPESAKLDIRRIDHIEITDYSHQNEAQAELYADDSADHTYSTYEETIQDPVQIVYYQESDTDVMKEISDVAILDHFSYVNSVFKPYEDQIDINIYYQTDKGFTNSYYVKIPRGKLPQKVRDDLDQAYRNGEFADTDKMVYTGAIVD